MKWKSFQLLALLQGLAILVTMAMRINPPVFKSDTKNYDRYKQELLAWKEVTDVPAAKQGIAIALTLPEGDITNIREKVFDEISLVELKADTGLQTLITYLDKKLGKDELEDSWEKFEDFEDYSRKDDETISQYIANFDQKYQRIVKKGMTLPPEILAFKLIRKANVTREEKLLVMTGMDYTQKAELYNQAMKSLNKFKGGVMDNGGGTGGSTAIKLEPAFLAQNEEALWNAGYVNRNQWRGANMRGPRGFRRGFRGNYNFGTGRGFQGKQFVDRKPRAINPMGPDGQPITCRSCGSYRHMIKDCPDSWENMAKASVNISDKIHDLPEGNSGQEEHVVLFTGYNKQEVSQLGVEARYCAVLDSACSSTVCGRAWMDNYLECLPLDDQSRVIRSEGEKLFRFGGGTILKSKAEYQVPAMLAGREVTLITDVVDSDIPLLLSRTAMKKALIKLDLVNDTAEVFGKTVALDMTSSGHYCLPIDRNSQLKVESVCEVKLDVLNAGQLAKVLLKLHRQFAHPSTNRLVALLKDAGIWSDDYRLVLDNIYQNCELCKRYAKTPSRPVVALPQAKAFNDRIAMDLKLWRNGKSGSKLWILHMIDMWSRLTVSCFIERKTPKAVLEKLMTNWIGVFGVMKSIMTDNGGEFNSDETREVASLLNLEVCTSAADSPFQNGLCERVHAVTDMMLLKLQNDNPGVSLDVLLCWANMARNSMQMWHGFSSNQLVFGVNPNLPNIMCDNVPALGGSTTSETFAKHINTLHSARHAFIQSESNERIRRALRHKVRASEESYVNGDRVFYKREGRDQWLGPAKVIFQDGKIVFVRHGGVFVRVSPNRLVKANMQVQVPSVSNAIVNTSESNGSGTNKDLQSPSFTEIIGNVGDSNENQEQIRVEAVGQQDLKSLKSGVKIRCKKGEEDDTVTILNRAGKATGKNKSWYNVRDSSGVEYSLDLSMYDWEIIPEEANIVLIPKAKHNDPDCIQAKLTELEKLKLFDTYEVVRRDEQDCISTTWVLWNKGDEVRARLVARGFEEKDYVRSDSPTVGKSSMRVFLALSASLKWKIKTTDIKSAFLQGKLLDRDVFLIPPEEANVTDGYVWKLKRCLYGLNDAARQFYNSVVETLLILGCSQSKLDPSMFFWRKEGGIEGILVSHIDDFLHAGSELFENAIMMKLRDRFLAGKIAEDQFQYIGFQIQQRGDHILLDQNHYVDNVKLRNLTSQRLSEKRSELDIQEYTMLRSLAGKINWTVQGSRPDLAFDLVEISMKFKKAVVNDLNKAMKALRHLKNGKSEIIFPCLENYSHWTLVVFSDAAHANLCDGISSMMGYIVFLVGKNSKCCPLSWNGCKIKRVVRSTLAAETLSLQMALEDAIYLKTMIHELITIEVPIVGFVDNRSLFESLHSTRMVEDKRLRIDIGSMKQLLQEKEVDIKWCPGENQLANCLTKKGSSNLDLLTVLQSGLLPKHIYGI
jgi:hypothetical protein